MKSFIGSTSTDKIQKYIILQNELITLDGLYDPLSQRLGLSDPLLNFEYLMGYPWKEKNTHAYTRLGSGRIRVSPIGKSHAHTHLLRSGTTLTHRKKIMPIFISIKSDTQRISIPIPKLHP
jgi:hypothetical protein